MGGFERGASEKSRGCCSGKFIGGTRMSKVFKGILEPGMFILWTDERPYAGKKEGMGTIDRVEGDIALMYGTDGRAQTFWKDRSNPTCTGKVYLIDEGVNDMALTTSNSTHWCGIDSGGSLTASYYPDPLAEIEMGAIPGCSCPRCTEKRNKFNSKGGIMNNVKELLKSKKQKLFEKYVLDCDGDLDFGKPQVQKFIFSLMNNDEFVNVLKEVEAKEEEAKKAKK
jgi:hypothetical protein